MNKNFFLKSSLSKEFVLDKLLISIGSAGDIVICDNIPELLPRHCSLCTTDADWNRAVINLSTLNPITVNGDVVETKKGIKSRRCS
ncbi:hypothetical protein QTN25_005811 [Entamoeba marina]